MSLTIAELADVISKAVAECDDGKPMSDAAWEYVGEQVLKALDEANAAVRAS